MKNEHRDNLKKYIKEDEIYQDYKNKKLDESLISDFDWFCIGHCEDILNVLDEVVELNKLLTKEVNKLLRIKQISIDKKYDDILKIVEEGE